MRETARRSSNKRRSTSRSEQAFQHPHPPHPLPSLPLLSTQPLSERHHRTTSSFLFVVFPRRLTSSSFLFVVFPRRLTSFSPSLVVAIPPPYATSLRRRLGLLFFSFSRSSLQLAVYRSQTLVWGERKRTINAVASENDEENLRENEKKGYKNEGSICGMREGQCDGEEGGERESE
jgi:hypothetical protein